MGWCPPSQSLLPTTRHESPPDCGPTSGWFDLMRIQTHEQGLYPNSAGHSREVVPLNGFLVVGNPGIQGDSRGPEFLRHQ
jgi:hypothetical protein